MLVLLSLPQVISKEMKTTQIFLCVVFKTDRAGYVCSETVLSSDNFWNEKK